MIKNKKAFIGASLMIVYALLIIVILSLLIWLGLAVSEGLVAVFSFLKQYWWAIALLISAILWRHQVRAVVNYILKKFGVKI